MINIAVCKNRKDKTYENLQIEFKQLVTMLSKTTRTNETYEEYLNLPKEIQDNIKDVGGFVGGYLIDGKRTKATVKYRNLLTLDVDHGVKGFMDFLEMCEYFESVVYTTHKHHKDRERVRLVIPLNRNVDNLEYQALGRKIASMMGIDNFDDSTYDPTRLMYFPSTAKDGEFRFLNIEAERLDVDYYLDQYEDYTDKTSWPVSSRVNKLPSHLDKKQQNPLEKDGIIGAFCKAYDIHEAIENYLSEEYKQTETKDRYTYVNGSTAGGMVVYENGLFAYSHHSTDPCSEKLCNAFDMVKNHKFKEFDEEEKMKRMVELISKDKEVIRILGKESLELAQREFGIINNNINDTRNKIEDIKTKESESSNTDMNWYTTLEVNNKGRLLNTINNIVIILENDKNLKNKIALNEFSHQITLRGHLPWRKIEMKNEIWTDRDDSSIRHYLERVYKIKSKEAIFDAITVVASKYSYHPIKEYLSSIAWDGKKRVENLFIDYLGASDTDYTREVSRKMLIAAVARVHDPGVKFDYMAVFVGKEGIGKSHLINLLGKEWYTDSINTVLGKEAYEQLQEAWIVEMAELSAVKKAETEAVKHFISKREDIYRVAYGRRVEKFKRQCVFFGTTNEETFLKDRNGNRRFWPVKVG
ncbi:MAG: VapE domain-containing protein, partial [Peptostreptococcaceae bacterium]